MALSTAQREAKNKRAREARAAKVAAPAEVAVAPVSVTSARDTVIASGRGIAVVAPSGFNGIVARVFRSGARLVTSTGTHLYGGACKHENVSDSDTASFEFVGGDFENWTDGYTGTLHSKCHREITA